MGKRKPGTSPADVKLFQHLAFEAFTPITSTVMSPDTCSQGTFHVNSTLQGGRSAGRFDYQGQVKNVLECLKKCCDKKDCDLAYMDMGRFCYTVRCKNKELCKTVPAIGGELSNVFYVSRANSQHKGKKHQRRSESKNGRYALSKLPYL